MAKDSGQAAARDKKEQEKLRAAGEIPRHIAVIMDGNGRWAKKRGMPRIRGHSEGVESVRDIVSACGELGVGFLTLYTFSTENWNRPEEEVSMLMRLLLKALRDETDRLNRNNVRLRVIGDLTRVPREVEAELRESIQTTSGNTGLTVVLALSYSGRWDITEAIRRIAGEVAVGKLQPAEISDAVVDRSLATAGIPDPDLLVRTSGEFRISNFLLWQLAYSEIYITDRYWPDFRRAELYEVIRDYQKRERRFGLVSEESPGRSPADGSGRRILKSVTGQ